MTSPAPLSAQSFAHVLYRIYESGSESPGRDARQDTYAFDYLGLLAASNFVTGRMNSVQNENGMLHGSFLGAGF